jgi:hypothetical protein
MVALKNRELAIDSCDTCSQIVTDTDSEFSKDKEIMVKSVHRSR